MRASLSIFLAALLVAASALQPVAAKSVKGKSAGHGSARVDIDPAEEREFPYDADIPGCQHTPVLEMISDQFAEKEDQYWKSRLTIAGFEQIQRTAWRPWGLDYVPRRFCSAVVTMSDGAKRKIDYSVRESGGAFGASFGVEFCVHGLDRNWAYSPACLAARP